MLHSLASQVLAVTGLFTCVIALILGSWRERMGAVFYQATYALSFGIGLISLRWAPWRFLLIDALSLLGFVYLCWKAPHPWPIWAAGLQLLSTAADVFALVSPKVMLWTLLTIDNGCSYLILLVLLIGTVATVRRRRMERQKSLI